MFAKDRTVCDVSLSLIYIKKQLDSKKKQRKRSENDHSSDRLLDQEVYCKCMCVCVCVCARVRACVRSRSSAQLHQGAMSVKLLVFDAHGFCRTHKWSQTWRGEACQSPIHSHTSISNHFARRSNRLVPSLLTRGLSAGCRRRRRARWANFSRRP